MTLKQPFPQTLSETNAGAGTDFPGSSGDRERGKFRPSATPRLTAVAVTNDDGTTVAGTLAESLDLLLQYQRAIVLGLSLLTDADLFDEVSRPRS